MAQRAPVGFLGQDQAERLDSGLDFETENLSLHVPSWGLVRRAKKKCAYLCHRENKIEFHRVLCLWKLPRAVCKFSFCEYNWNYIWSHKLFHILRVPGVTVTGWLEMVKIFKIGFFYLCFSSICSSLLFVLHNFCITLVFLHFHKAALALKKGIASACQRPQVWSFVTPGQASGKLGGSRACQWSRLMASIIQSTRPLWCWKPDVWSVTKGDDE